MATKNFTQFSTAAPLLTSDYIVGYNAAGTAELKATVKQIVDLVSDSGQQSLSYNEAGSLSISNGNNVTLSSFDTVDATNKLLSAGTDLFDIFLTSETDSQTLSYNEAGSLSISNGNNVTLSSFDTVDATNKLLSAGTDLFDIFLTSETDSQTLSYNEAGSLSISNGNNVTLSSFDTVDATNKLLSAGTDLFDIFLTSETDSQTLSFNEGTKDLSISSGNTVSLSSLSDTAFATTSATFLTIPAATSSYIQQDKIFLTQPLLKTFQKITLIDYPQSTVNFTFLGVGDSMGWRKPSYAIMPYLWNRYGIGGAVFDGLVKRAFGNVTTTWAPNEGNYSLWENGEVAYVGSGGSIEWGIQDGLPAGVNAGYLYSNQITVYSVASATGGTFKVQYSTDRSTWTDVTALTSVDTMDVTGPKALISTGTAPSLGYYTWRVLGLTGTSIIISAKILNTSDPGAVCGLIFRGGITIASSNTVLSAIFNPIIADVAPDLVMWEQKDNPEDYVTGLPTYLNRWDSCFTAVSARPDWVLVGTNDTQANDTNTEQIRQTTKQVADSRKLAYFDFNGAIGGWEGIQRMRWDWDTTGAYDPVHLNDNAQRVGAQIFLRSAGIFTTPFKSDISQNVNDGGTLIYSLNSNSILSTPLNVGLQVNGTPGGATSLRLGSRNSIGTWGIYKLSPTDGQAPYGFNIAGGLNNDARIRLDSDGRTAIRQTGVGDTWPRTERLWVGESVPTYSTLTINHNNYGTDNQMTGKLLKATYKGNEVASIDYRGVVNALSGNSEQWNSTYTTFQSNSGFYIQSRSTLETPTTGISAVSNIVTLSQATYDALTVKLPTTMYVIV